MQDTTGRAFSETQGVSVYMLALSVGIVLLADVIVFATLQADERAATLPWLLLPLILVAVLLGGVRMHTRVDDSGLHVRTLWLVRRHVPMAEIASAAAVRYRPIRDYGGWGVRFSRRGRAYNMRGDQGVQLVLRDGRRVLIGSQRAEDLARALHAAGVPEA